MDKHHDEELFQSLDKGRRRKKRKLIFTVISCILILGLVGSVVVSSLKESVWNKFGAGAGQILQCQAEIGTVRRTVSGSGILADLDLEKISVPEGVEILDVLDNM